MWFVALCFAVSFTVCNKSNTVRANVNAMEENVTFNIHLSTVESEDNILVNAMSYTMYKIGTFLIYLVILGPVRFSCGFLATCFWTWNGTVCIAYELLKNTWCQCTRSEKFRTIWRSNIGCCCLSMVILRNHLVSGW